MRIDIIYIDDNQNIFHESIEVEEQCSVKEAIMASSLLEQDDRLSIDALSVGIFSQKVSLSHSLREGERIEIYRDLTISPMDKRRLLASKRK